MRYKLFTICLSAFLVSFGDAQSDSAFAIFGRVVSKINGVPIVGSIILISASQKGISLNDTSGSFKLTGLTKGHYTLQWSFVGYLPQDTVITITNHDIENIAWPIIAKPNGKSLNDIVTDHVHAPSYQQRSKQLAIGSKQGYLLSPTMLDSLQGTWISATDSSWQLTVSGRTVDDTYKQDNGRHEFFSVYFSDTLVDGSTLAISQAKINTSATSGNYLVEVSQADETIFCYKIIGFYYDGTHTTFTFQPTWTDRGPNVFIKQ